MFMKMITIALVSLGDANDAMPNSLDQTSKSSKFLNAIVIQVLFIPLRTRLVARFIKQNVDFTIFKCRPMLIYAENREMDKTEVPLPCDRSSSNASRNFKNSVKRESKSKHQARKTLFTRVQITDKIRTEQVQKLNDAML